jgi:hypothetical protein
MTEISAEGTPIDALESGNVPNSADASRMAQILQDMNASGAEVAGVPPMGGATLRVPQNELMPQAPLQQVLPPHSGIPMAGMTGQMPPMVQQQMPPPPQNSQFVPYDDEHTGVAGGGGPRKNAWGTFLERLTDPLVVAVLIFALSLPALHTFGSKYATWAFAVGGQLSWLGLMSKALLGGLLFWLYKSAASFL